MDQLHGLAMALWQTDASPSQDQHLLMICIAVIAGAMLLQAVMIAVAGMAAMKALKEVKDLTHDLHSKVVPILNKTTEVITDVSPKIRTVSENATHISYRVREKVDEAAEILGKVNRMVSETNDRTRAQVEHVDRMVTSALDTAEEVSHTVANGIRVPVRQVAATMAGLRTGFDTLLKNFGIGQSGGGQSNGDPGTRL